MLEFVIDVIDTFNISTDETRVGVVVYSSDSSLKLYLDSTYDRNELYNRIRGLAYQDGQTNTAAGLQTTREIVYRDGYGKRSDAPDIVVLITDGIATVRADETLDQADLLKQTAEIVVVGVTNNVDVNTLEAIATDPNAVILIDDFSGLQASLSSVLTGLCPGEGTWSLTLEKL